MFSALLLSCYLLNQHTCSRSAVFSGHSCFLHQ